MTVSTMSGNALRLSRTTVAQYLSAHKRINGTLAGNGDPQVLLLRGEPVWDDPNELALGAGRRARVATGPSPLAVHELVLTHLTGDNTPSPRMLVILTDIEEHDLDPAILARTHRGRIHTVNQWDIVQEAFSATGVDPRLKAEAWACEALLDAAGTQGWHATLAGGMLSRNPALAALTARRLRLERTGDRIDPPSLLRWSHTPGGPELLLDLRPAERDGIIEFLSEAEQSGSAGRILLALTKAGHGADAVAYGLLCAALWQHATPDHAVYQMRGRVERWLGDHPPATDDALGDQLTAFGRACEEYITDLLGKARTATDQSDDSTDRPAREARKITDTVLGQADLLVRQFSADTAAAASPLLTAGLEARFTAAGNALGAGKLTSIDAAVQSLRDHNLAADHPARIRRVRMAQRLTRWLATDPDSTTDTVAAALERQIGETSWVDRALDYLEAGGDDDPAVRLAYQALGGRVREQRSEFDREFAKSLAVWTESGTDPGSMLTVETFLARVVRPVAATQRVLLLVIDGLSAAIATELATQLRQTFAEYDPLPDNKPRRRAMAAALPSLTAVSRTSLFAGTLMRGDQKDEARLFPQHRFWGSRKAAVFHKDDLRSGPGDRFGADLEAAIFDPNSHVAVVLNTIDDRLAKEQKLGDAEWQIREIGDLRALLSAATGQGMAVLITSDHGHVIDRHDVKLDCANPESARHRLPQSEYDRLADTEIALRGPRVVWPEPGAAIVALWDSDSRYTTRKAGYHGGASLAEMTIPVLAFLPFGATPPKGWRELGDQEPAWWALDPETAELTPPPQQEKAKRARQRAQDALTNQMSLDLPTPAEAPSAPVTPAVPGEQDLVTRLLSAPVFEVQLEQLARKPAIPKLEKAIRALLDGPQPITALAQRVGDPPTRANGFAAILGQLLNVDGAQVLETLPDGRTVRLHTTLLRQQFELR